MTVEQVKTLSEKYLNADRMIWVVVGDAKTQLARLNELGFGDPIVIQKVGFSLRLCALVVK